MLAGAFATAMSLLCLAWVRRFSELLLIQNYISNVRNTSQEETHPADPQDSQSYLVVRFPTYM